MRAMRVSNPRIRELQSEMENDDVLRYVMICEFCCREMTHKEHQHSCACMYVRVHTRV